MYTVQGELRAVCDRGLPAQGNKKAESLSLSGTPLLITTSNSLGRRIITSDVEDSPQNRRGMDVWLSVCFKRRFCGLFNVHIVTQNWVQDCCARFWRRRGNGV